MSLQNGYIFLLSTFDDVSPIQINTGLQGPLCMEWSNSREYLAVSGITVSSTKGNQPEFINSLKFYNEKGMLLFSTIMPDKQVSVHLGKWNY